MQVETFVKPVPQNRKLSRGRGSRLFLNKEYVQCWDAIKTEFSSQASEPLNGDVSVSIEFGWKRMDLDSCVKSILDVLQGIAYANDRQVTELKIVRCKKEKIIVVIEKK
ncbi:MAG: RusA family crossover junction endodeoxyribonuclease [Chryseotalea sp.]